MPDEINSPESSVGENSNPNPTEPINDGTNPTPPIKSIKADKKLPPQSEPPQSISPPSKKPKSLLFRILIYLSKVVAIVFGTGSTLLFLAALWDSYRPKITVSPGPSINSKEPFGTIFIIQNQGALPIRNVSFNMTWTYADANLPRNAGFGLTKIPELEPLEQHALISPPLQVPATPTNKHSEVTQPNVPMPVEHHSLVLWFDVTYDPQYFGSRTTTIYFFGLWDTETNFQWLPTGNFDIRMEQTDTNLLARALATTKSIEQSHIVVPNPPNPPNLPTNGTVPSPNGGPVNAPPSVKIENGAAVHTN